MSADAAIDVIARELGGVDASLVFASRMAGFDIGFKLLRRRGTCFDARYWRNVRAIGYEIVTAGKSRIAQHDQGRG